VSTGGLRHAVATLQRGEGGERGIRKLLGAETGRGFFQLSSLSRRNEA